MVPTNKKIVIIGDLSYADFKKIDVIAREYRYEIVRDKESKDRRKYENDEIPATFIRTE